MNLLENEYNIDDYVDGQTSNFSKVPVEEYDEL